MLLALFRSEKSNFHRRWHFAGGQDMISPIQLYMYGKISRSFFFPQATLQTVTAIHMAKKN